MNNFIIIRQGLIPFQLFYEAQNFLVIHFMAANYYIDAKVWGSLFPWDNVILLHSMMNIYCGVTLFCGKVPSD